MKRIFKSFKLWTGFVSFFSMVFVHAAPPTNLVYGDDFEGGKIACLVAQGEAYNLIAAPADNSEGITWGGTGRAVGPPAQSDTDGAANTAAIVNAIGTDSQYAALLCNNYEIDSKGNTPCKNGNACYNDWFLPSKDQLNCLFRHKQVIGGFTKAFYWSSTEFAGYPEYSAWDRFFSDETHPLGSEDDFDRVRCVRSIRN